MAGATGVAATKEPKARKRIDPKPRHLDGYGPWVVRNRLPGYRYTGVYKGNPDMGVEYYASMGWEPVRWQGLDEAKKPRGEYFAGGILNRTEGEIIEYRSHVLMRIAEEDYAAIFQYGIDGNTGQQWADEQEKRIRGGKGVDRDPLRGMSLMGEDGPIVRMTDKKWSEEDEEDDG